MKTMALARRHNSNSTGANSKSHGFVAAACHKKNIPKKVSNSSPTGIIFSNANIYICNIIVFFFNNWVRFYLAISPTYFVPLNVTHVILQCFGSKQLPLLRSGKTSMSSVQVTSFAMYAQVTPR